MQSLVIIFRILLILKAVADKYNIKTTFLSTILHIYLHLVHQTNVVLEKYISLNSINDLYASHKVLKVTFVVISSDPPLKYKYSQQNPALNICLNNHDYGIFDFLYKRDY